MLELSEKVLEAWGKEAVELIQDNIKSLPVTRFGAMNTTGRTAASVRYELTAKGLALYGAGHIFVVETGRKGGKFPPIAVIKQWIEDKPIIPRDKISKNSLAFLIARSIARKGTLLHQMGGKSGVLSNVINAQRINELKEALFLELNTVIRSALVEAYA